MVNFIDLQLITVYLIIGIVGSFLTDITLYMTKSGERLTFRETLIVVLIWPLILSKVVRDLFKD